jgi:hypothetical protein
MCKLFLSILLIFFSVNLSFGQQDSTNNINSSRLILTSSSAVAVLGGSYAYIQNSWWSEQSSSFHFDDGSDLRYAKNIDKGGHFLVVF